MKEINDIMNSLMWNLAERLILAQNIARHLGEPVWFTFNRDMDIAVGPNSDLERTMGIFKQEMASLRFLNDFSAGYAVKQGQLKKKQIEYQPRPLEEWL